MIRGGLRGVKEGVRAEFHATPDIQSRLRSTNAQGSAHLLSPSYVLPDLLQTLNEDRVVNPFAANEGEITSIRRQRKILNFYVA
jgi:hypothetical protein